MNVLRVSFRDFWPGFHPEDFFLPLLQMGLGAPQGPLPQLQVVEPWAPCDFEIVSVFPGGVGARRRLANAGRRLLGRANLEASLIGRPSPWAERSIWYTGENVRPPHAPWHATWSFDADSMLSRNYTFPLWFLLFPELVGLPSGTMSPENRSGLPLSLASATSSRSIDTGRRPKFACAFIGNPEPTRLWAISALRQIGEVDVFGPSVGKVVTRKWEVASEYRFMICFENSVTPGYVTEKVFDAWACATVPIWNGIDRDAYLNPSAMLNLADLGGSMDVLLDRVASIEADPTRVSQMASAPILTRRPTLERILSSLRLA